MSPEAVTALAQKIELPEPHEKQQEIITDPAKRKVIRAGRRAGKTIVAAIIAVTAFMEGRRVLYGAPTEDQIDRFWTTIKRALEKPLDEGYYYKNETKHIIELYNSEQRIRAKTAYDADTLRGDYADLLILDEYQNMKPNAWQLVGAPMLLDNDGDAIFIYTTRAGKKGDHARKLYEFAGDPVNSPRWAAFNFSSFANPHLSEAALDEISTDMNDVDYRMEILAEEMDDDPNALWSRELIEKHRVLSYNPLYRIVVGVDPPGSVNTECGILVAGVARIGKDDHVYIIDDRSLKGKPFDWGEAVVSAYRINEADRVLGEGNYGGDMVESTIEAVVKLAQDDSYVAFKEVRATRGKAVRAEPVSALYEKGLVHHVGTYPELENEMCRWVPGEGMASPNRLDALVWCITDLLVGKNESDWDDYEELGEVEGYVSVWRR